MKRAFSTGRRVVPRVDLAPLEPVVRAFRARRAIRVKEIADAVRTLHAMFTKQARFRPDYMADPHLRLGYAAYWTPVGAGKLVAVLQELAWFDPDFVARPKLSILDVGCGPGAGLLGALLFWRGRAARLEYAGTDRVRDVFDECRLFEELARGAYSDLPASQARYGRSFEGDRFDLIVLSNAYVEIRSRELVEGLLRRALTPGGYLAIIEPGDREETLELMRLRDALAAGGYRVSAPCLPQGPCPMLRSDPEMWCSMEAPIRRPRFLAEVDDRVGFDKRALKYSYLVLTREGRGLGSTAPAGSARLVGDLHRPKGRFQGVFCSDAGELARRRLLARDVTEANRPFTRAARGRILAFEDDSVKTVDNFPEPA